MLILAVSVGYAQRYTDRLDRGLVAMKVSGGVYLSWRILAEEYYDVTYNVYRDGSLVNDEPLTTSNFRDTGGSTSSSYTVAALVRGEEQTQCKAVMPWGTSYKEIQLTHEGIKSTLVPNDACCADVDGDGELEILMKFDNLSEIEQSFPKNGPTIDGVVTKEYSIFEVLKLDGTRLWWVNCGPNMGDFQNNEQNMVAYDWDGDGRAEVIMRAADGTVIHKADGTTYTVGNASANVRGATGGGANWFVTTDGEYLLYMDGLTGEPYQCIPYPLKRLESGETDLNKAWGDGYGHRCSKHFFGAPYLDGRKPSIFLARGIYTRHKMIAYDVNPANHSLVERWRWFNNTNGPWKGQGYHNFGIADVDWDGRDEIVFGSMVIDDNGKGLSTTGLGHGDAQHCSDFNPYIHGQEIYACMEDNPGNNYRDATTSKIYHRFSSGNDDGRSMAGNFTNSFPGGLGCSAREGAISTITGEAVNGLNATGVHTNFRIYWDGDLCSESFNYRDGKNTEGVISKYGSWSAIYTCAGSLTNNDTKGTPCYQGDILGDWREEIIMRTANNNIRIYSTPTLTKFRVYSLWYDHQYRNAMVWQMCGYNQPPHTSYFLGEMEGITLPPPPLTMTDRVEVTNGSSISAALNGQHAIVCEMGNTSVNIEGGVQPSVLTFFVPTWVQGTAASESTNQNASIKYATYACDVTGGGLSGETRLVKQGDGVLNLPKADFTHTGATDIWAGVVNFDGTMKQSPLWLNRFAELNSDGGEFLSIKADYASVIRPGGADNKGVITTEALDLGFGSRIVADLYSENTTADIIRTGSLSIETKSTSAWVNAGPPYLAPVIELVGHLAQGESDMKPGKYVIAEISGAVTGDVKSIILEGLDSAKKKLFIDDGKLILEIVDMRDAGSVVWTGATNSVWDLAESANFALAGEDKATTFVSGDAILFNDDAATRTVNVAADVQPASVTVNNTQAYTFNGSGSIGGTAQFIKEGTGMVTMNGQNAYTGGNHLRGGTTRVSALANQYSATGNLGAITTTAGKFTIEDGAILQTTAAVENASSIQFVGEEGGVINNNAEFIQAGTFTGTKLTKRGTGNLKLMQDNNVKTLVIAAGSASASSNKPAGSIEFQGGTFWDDVQSTTVPLYVPKGKKGIFQLTYTYYTAYANKLTGEGELTIVPRNTVQRVRITGDWTQFEGTVKHTNKDIWLPLDMSSGMPKGTLFIDAGCSVCNTAKAFTVGQLTGSGSLVQAGPDFKSQTGVKGNNTWNVGNSDGKNFTFDGTFTDDGGSNKTLFNKIGTCKMTVSGKSTHSGTTQIQGGELCLKAGATLGIGALTVNKGATLSGVTGANSNLTNSSVTIASGGTLQVGTSATSVTGIQRFGGKNVTINKGAFLHIGVLKAATASSVGCTILQNIGQLMMNGTVQLHLSDDFIASAAVGDYIELWKDVTAVTGTPNLDPESVVINAEKGLYWDTTDIAKGILRVAYDPTVGIRGVAVSDINAPVYDLNGHRVTQPRPGRVYIINGHKVLVTRRTP